MSKTFKKIFFIWLIYVVLINLYVLSLDYFHLLHTQVHSLKEVVFAVWGYGWDGMHYLKIAMYGYKFPLQAFFPFYPLIIKTAHLIFPWTLAYRLNIVLLLGVLLLLYKLLGYLKIPQSLHLKVLCLFLSFPTAFFLQANYTESLYILLSACGLLFLLENKYLKAAVFAGLLSATKVSGISLGFVIIASYLIKELKNFDYQRDSWIKLLSHLVLYAGLSSFGLIIYFMYLRIHFGSYEIFFVAQEDWGREFINQSSQVAIYFANYFIPIYKAVLVWDVSVFRRLSELLTVVFMVFSLVKSYKKIPLPAWLYSLFQVVIPISTGSFLSFNRLALLAYPVLLFGLSYLTKNKYVFWIALLAMLTSQFFGIYLFLNNVFVG